MTEQGKALLGDGIPDTQIDVREVFGLDIDLICRFRISSEMIFFDCSISIFL